MANREFYQVGLIKHDIVGDYFEKVYKNYKGNPQCEVQDFENSDTRISLLKINNRTKAFVIETRTDFNDLEYIYDTVDEITHSKQELLDCIKNLMGVLDTPLGRKKIRSDFSYEARDIARNILQKYI